MALSLVVLPEPAPPEVRIVVLASRTPPRSKLSPDSSGSRRLLFARGGRCGILDTQARIHPTAFDHDVWKMFLTEAVISEIIGIPLIRKIANPKF
jgi:hypothetical protein